MRVDGIILRRDDIKIISVVGQGEFQNAVAANVIEQLQKPTLVIARNKTLAVQLYSEFKQFFHENAVEYMVWVDWVTTYRKDTTGDAHLFRHKE